MPQAKKMEGNPDANLTSVGNYSFMKTLGEGNFAKVKLAKHKVTNQEVAIKIIDKMQLDEVSLSKLYREVRIMKLLHHPNIVKIYEVVETKFTIFLVMEYVSGGELYDYLVVHGRMKEKEARAKFRQIVSAVSYCHHKRVIHRDLKAENILLDQDANIKIADFGFSNQFDPEGKLETFCGSPPYAAPELFQGKKYIGPEVDVWSLGVILYVLTTGCLPFEGKNLQEMRDSVCRGKYRVPFYLSEGCEKLLRKFLVRDPQKRPTLNILLDDEWLNEGYTQQAVTEDVRDQLVGEDPLVLSIMESKFGYNKEEVLKGLMNNVHDAQMAIYFLLYNEKLVHGEAGLIRIGDQMAMKSPVLQPAIHHLPQPASTIGVIAEERSVESMNNEEQKIQEPAHHAEVQVVVPRRRSSIAPDAPRGPPPAQSSGAAKIPAIAKPVKTPVATNDNNAATTQVKRVRRNTVSGQQQGEDALKDMQEMQQKVQDMAVTEEPEPTADTSTMPRPVPRQQPVLVNPNRRASVAVPDAKHDSTVAAAAQKPQGKINFTGLLKSTRRTSEDENKTQFKKAATSDDDTSEETEATPAANGSGPRSLRFTFNLNTTSSKDPDVIVKDVLAACLKHNIKTKLLTNYHIECAAPPPNSQPGSQVVRLEIEICKLPRLKNLHGLKLKRQSGATNDYKIVCEQLLASIKL